MIKKSHYHSQHWTELLKLSGHSSTRKHSESFEVQLTIAKYWQKMSNIGKNRQILLNLQSNVVKSFGTLSNGDLLSIIPCDFNDGRVSHVDQEVGEGYLTADKSRG